jgi:hypothetical protein
MDLRVYYQKIRKIEADIREPDVVIVSRETPDGGKPGVRSDVPRSVAARLIAEEKADLASPDEARQFREEVEAKWKAAEEAPVAGLGALRSALKPARKT